METNLILVGDARELVKTLPDNSIHCIVTSPPYFGLRDYGVEGQIGLEPTVDEYVGALVFLFRELRRTLREDGVLFLNLGDSYGRGARVNNPNDSSRGKTGNTGQVATVAAGAYGIGAATQNKQLLGIPWRVALALQADGWWLRSDIVWEKPNCMPDSVKDRPTRSHEYVFMLTKSARYYYDADAIREPHTDPNSIAGHKNIGRGKQGYARASGLNSRPQRDNHGGLGGNPAGRNKRTVWTINTVGSSDAHFAKMPPKLAEICILAGTSAKGVCTNCSAPYRRSSDTWQPTCTCFGHFELIDPAPEYDDDGDETVASQLRQSRRVFVADREMAEPVPAIVLDPFLGSGTTAFVARSLGRRYIGFELNESYAEMAKKKIGQTQPSLLMDW